MQIFGFLSKILSSQRKHPFLNAFSYTLKFLCLIFLSPIHLPPIMPPDAPYRLPQGVRPAVLVVRMRCLMLVEYDHGSLLRILRIMQIPVMPGIVALYRHIIGIRGYDVEILRIQTLQIIRIKHRQPPFRHTTHPEPS